MIEKDNGYVENARAEERKTENTGAEGEMRCPSTASTAIGKFKDVDALLKAYDCLQAEFTRRSQRLKQLEKEAENSRVKSGSAVVEKLRENAERTRVETEKFNGFVADLEQSSVRDGSNGALDENEPANEGTEVRETQADVRAGNSVAPSADAVENRVVESIAEKVGEEDKASFAGETSVAERRDTQPSSSNELYRMANEDEQVRLRIIGEYLQSLGKTGAPLAKGGSGLLSTPPLKAKTLREAGEMALRMFRQGAGV